MLCGVSRVAVFSQSQSVCLVLGTGLFKFFNAFDQPLVDSTRCRRRKRDHSHAKAARNQNRTECRKNDAFSGDFFTHPQRQLEECAKNEHSRRWSTTETWDSQMDGAQPADSYPIGEQTLGHVADILALSFCSFGCPSTTHQAIRDSKDFSHSSGIASLLNCVLCCHIT